MSKRALGSSSSSGQPSQPKRTCVAPIDQEWNGPETNLMLSYCLTKEDVRSMLREELERFKSEWADYAESSFRNAFRDIVQEMLSKNDFQRLKEAAEPANSHSSHLGRANAKSTAKNVARNLQLQLQTKLSLPVFTGKKIEGKEGARIYIALVDANTGEVVTSGPESSIKLEVVVLEGDFNNDNEDSWAPEEFENYVVKERAGRGPLLTGDLAVKLKEGVGELGKMIFTDNSSWNRSKTFRIGLKVASGYCGNARIREAKTDAFPVKEHRGEAYKKHHPPASDDEVWRLENIAKDGVFDQKLSKAGIHTVEDFLLQLFTDPKKLREILGKSMTEKKWDSLVCHAKTCKTKWKLYFDYPNGTMKHGAVFNSDGQLICLVKDTVYFALHQLSAQEKEHGDTIVNKALANWNDVREFNAETYSDSMEKNSSSSFSSQVADGQIENLNPVQRYLAPPIFAAPVRPEAPPANVLSIAEGPNGEIALAWQNIYSGNSSSVDEIFGLAAQQPMSADRLHLISPGYHGSTTTGLPRQSHGIDLHNAMCSQRIDSSSQIDYEGYDNVLPFEPSNASNSSFLSSGTLPLPEGDHVMGDSQSIDSDDNIEDWLVDDSSDNGYARGTGRSVIGWLKIKAVLQWGFFVRRRSVRIVELDVPPIGVQACS